MKSAQIFASVHAACKLNPPVIASMSRHSPQKKSPPTFFDIIDEKSISVLSTPPHITNSSLCADFPVAEIFNADTFSASVRSAFLGRVAKTV